MPTGRRTSTATGREGRATTTTGRGVLRDTTGPELSITVSPSTLWPPNHKYRTVQATISVSDDADPDPTVTLVSVTSNEPDDGEDDGNTVNDIVIVDDDTFRLRAERSGTGTGRVYTITYRATDACGTARSPLPRSRCRSRSDVG